MRCQFCDFLDTQVKDSRPSEDNQVIKRRRFCQNCGAKFTTYERIEMRDIMVVKKNGDIKMFDREKLIKSIEIATRKRDILMDKIDSIVSSIRSKIERFSENEVSTQTIGQLVMSHLKEVDHVSYIRYASVYLDFHDLHDFVQFIKQEL